ncbi:1487_t:CDS:2 [Cetraspora pellucida]|uniref:1487_t:CDS:1 n=1 Tax=Cetraspora pellucida TaxID=1433469 RepID=A0ACA9L7L4_9GLOM|nr:1487_t:CDS:2 [Cetraspora pellucida]
MELNNQNKENYDPVRRTFSNSGEDGYLRQRVTKNTQNPLRKHGRNPLSEICTNILEETLEVETETVQELIASQQEINLEPISTTSTTVDETISSIENETEIGSSTSTTITTSQSSSTVSHEIHQTSFEDIIRSTKRVKKNSTSTKKKKATKGTKKSEKTQRTTKRGKLSSDQKLDSLLKLR